MSNPFPSSYELHYVYAHIDPVTKELLYIGMGKGSRAYATKTSKIDTVRYSHRSPEHAEHLEELLKCGYLPHEWITFLHRGLDKKSALSIERELIAKDKPIYNRSQGIKLLKFEYEDVLKMKSLRDSGMYYRLIAEEMGCSTMVAHRIVNDLSPRYKEMMIDNQ